jgi:hypothetical protein
MKRIKMMLLSLALFAVVGGALAFKARFQTQYCTAPTQDNGTCGVACAAFTKSTTINAQDFFCTTTPFAGGCKDSHNVVLTCNTSTQLIGD